MERVPEGIFRVRFLGNFALTDPTGHQLSPRGQKPTALLAYLLFNAGQEISREKLMELLWTGRAPKQGRDSLRQALHALRTTLQSTSPELLKIDRVSVYVPQERIATDLWTDEGSIRWTLSAPFLEDLRGTAPGFDDWLAETERAIRSQQISAAERRLTAINSTIDPEEALGCAEAVLSLDPHNEATARLAMEIYAHQGKRGHALRVYERLSAALQADDFDVSTETRELILAISENRFPAPAVAVALPEPQATPLVSAASGRGLPKVWIALSQDEHDQDVQTHVSNFFDHLILRFVQMPDLRLLTAADQTGPASYGIMVSAGATQEGPRVSMRLRAPDQQVIWTGRAELQSDPSDDQIQLAVDRLVMQMLPTLEEHVYFSQGKTLDTAYGCYIQAKRVFWTAPETGYIDQVLSCLHRAIEIDPDFMPPYTMLIMYYNTGMFMSQPGVDHSAKRALAFDLAQKLLFLNSQYPNSHIAMGWCLLWRSNFDAAERSLRRAMELKPYEPHRLNVIGTALVYLGHHDEGIAYYDMAQERVHHDFDFQRTDYGEVYFFKGAYETALSWMEVPEIRTPYKTYYFRALANALLDRPEQARAEVEAFVEDIQDRWAGPMPFTPEAGFQWYSDMLPLRALSDRQTLHEALRRLGFSVKISGIA